MTKQPKKAQPPVKVEDLEPKQDVKGGGQVDDRADIIVGADAGGAARKTPFQDALITEITIPK